MRSIAWTIAGSDSSGEAGIQADLATFRQFDIQGCSVITAITAQNKKNIDSIFYVPEAHIQSQIDTLNALLPPRAIKISMLGNTRIETIKSLIKKFHVKIVCDPVLFATSGTPLFKGEVTDYLNQLKCFFPYIDLLTPNLREAEIILGYSIRTFNEMEKAARDLLKYPIKSVLIKGGHFNENFFSQDYWTDGKESFWLSGLRKTQKNLRGTGCTLSSAITSALALEFGMKDALVIGKMYMSQAIRLSEKSLFYGSWPESISDLPYLTKEPLAELPKNFPSCNDEPLGLYPIIDTFEWLPKLLPLGVKTIQLRIKNKSGIALENEIKKSIDYAKQYNVRLFINDYWELALKNQAYGVHLGQEDLMHVDTKLLRNAGLRLGISTHCYYEVATAHAHHPSYIACGPIFETTSKIMPFLPQGIEKLKRWRRTLDYPLVAIGGIQHRNISEVKSTGVDGIALISAITAAANPIDSAKELLQLLY